MENNISIALATYNGSKYITAQIYSIMAQTVLPAEIVIVDDTSVDDTVNVLKMLQSEFPIIKIYLNTDNLGPVRSFKKAISHCTGKYIALCDQDDVWEAGKLELCLTELRHVEAGTVPSMVFTDLKVIDEHGNLLASSFWTLQGYRPEAVTFAELLIGNIVTGCTIMMNVAMKTLVEQMPDDVIMHDHWIAMIAYSLGNVKAISESPIGYRVHQSSVTDKGKITFRQRLALFASNILDRKKLYLADNILQAEKFQNLYRSKLSESSNQVLQEFVFLKDKSSMYRKIHVGIKKYCSGK